MSINPELPLPSSNLAADLVALASEKTSDKRVELLRRITDVYLVQPGKLTAAEDYLFEEIIKKLIGKIAGPQKAEASEILAQMPSVPAPVVDAFALDRDIAVARPMILHRDDMSETTLVEVATSRSQDHLHAIANRSSITPPVTDIVVTRGNQTVVRALAANNGAQFSERGMSRLIRKSEDDETLQSLLVERSDLTPGAVAALLPLISNELASRLRGVAAEFNESVVASYLVEWTMERKKNIERTEAYIIGIRNGDLRLNDVILEMAHCKRLLDCATVIAAMIDLDRNYTFNLLTGGRTDSVILLLKSVSLSWPATQAFLKLRIAKTGIDEFELFPRRSDYEAIDEAAARRVVRFMKVRKAAVAKA